MGIKVGVLGATGYTGVELLRLLSGHPGVTISWITSEKFAGKKIYDVFPHLRGFLDAECSSISKFSELESVDLAFSCLPHGTSMHFVAKLLKSGSRVIDLSSDFRLKDVTEYEKWYKTKHKYSAIISESVYGLSEINRDEIKNAGLVSNPGCFSTAVILGLYPAVLNKLVDTGGIVADIKSGISGGGRAPALGRHFPESNEEVSVDSVSGHNQQPEIEQELSTLSNADTHVTFIHHTVPINRGILATVYARLVGDVDVKEVIDLYQTAYRGERFVRLYQEGGFPTVTDVRATNVCGIGVGVQNDNLIIISAVDNLVKGASGQAVQNMNIMFGFSESEGLDSVAVYP